MVKRNNYMTYILSYKLSQDHIEMFFSAIRARGGFNNNPTAAQFEGAYKRLVMHAEISTSSAANCLAQDATSILSIPSTSIKAKSKIDDLLIEDLQQNLNVDDEMTALCEEQISLTTYVDDITEYIAGFVAKKVTSLVKCEICANVLVDRNSFSSLLNRKNRGGLCKASKDVVKLCKAAERVIHFYDIRKSVSLKQLILNVLKDINLKIYFAN